MQKLAKNYNNNNSIKFSNISSHSYLVQAIICIQLVGITGDTFMSTNDSNRNRLLHIILQEVNVISNIARFYSNKKNLNHIQKATSKEYYSVTILQCYSRVDLKNKVGNGRKLKAL